MTGGRLHRNPDVVFRHVDGDTVLVHLRTNEIFSLNRTAGALWELVGDGITYEELRQRLLADFDVATEQLDEELARTVSELKSENLLVDD